MLFTSNYIQPKLRAVDLFRNSKAIFECEVDTIESSRRIVLSHIKNLKNDKSLPSKMRVNGQHLRPHEDFPLKGRCITFSQRNGRRQRKKDVTVVYLIHRDSVVVTNIDFKELAENGYTGETTFFDDALTQGMKSRLKYGLKIPLSDFKLGIELVQNSKLDYSSKLLELEVGSFSYAICNILIKTKPAAD